MYGFDESGSNCQVTCFNLQLLVIFFIYYYHSILCIDVDILVVKTIHIQCNSAECKLRIPE